MLDGWGYRKERDGNAIELGNTPVWHRMWHSLPRTLLEASGLAVGLPEGQMGNSEVGHLNLGAGRVVPQDIVRIDQAIESGEFFQLKPLTELCRRLKDDGGTLHLIGLLGYGGVHAIDRHLVALLRLAAREDLPRVAVHGFLDGRDSPPTSGRKVVADLAADIERILGDRGVIATLTGRYYAMDRDRRWDRTELAYRALVHGAGRRESDPVAAVADAYQRGETDEFIRPIVLEHDGEPRAKISQDDGVVCFNFRTDRMRQLVRALAVEGFDGFAVTDRPRVRLVTMTQYDKTFEFDQAFPPFSMARIVGEVLADQGRSQFRTAETEKYPHVTYFFNGGHEPPYINEERCLVPSPRDVATYDLAPEMSARGITEALTRAMASREHDFLLCNFANADMVGHTGVQSAIIEAVETVDRCLERILATAERHGTTVLVTADHGNCEVMVDPETGGPHTAHTTSPVPLVLFGERGDLKSGGALCDVGPTVLGMLGLEQPAEMTGRDLRMG